MKTKNQFFLHQLCNIQLNEYSIMKLSFVKNIKTLNIIIYIMSKNPTILQTFNNQLVEFFDDVLRIFPDELDIIKTKTISQQLER